MLLILVLLSGSSLSLERLYLGKNIHFGLWSLYVRYAVKKYRVTCISKASVMLYLVWPRDKNIGYPVFFQTCVSEVRYREQKPRWCTLLTRTSMSWITDKQASNKLHSVGFYLFLLPTYKRIDWDSHSARKHLLLHCILIYLQDQ